jgi:transcriptional regulator with XRE-family HTH domain
MIEKKPRRAHEVDQEIGLRIRIRRLDRGLSQTELGGRIGATVEDLQQYEKGTTRVGAGRLQRLAEALDVPISYFFANEPGDVSISNFLRTTGSFRLLKAYEDIKSTGMRRLLVQMAEGLAFESQASDGAGNRES